MKLVNGTQSSKEKMGPAVSLIFMKKPKAWSIGSQELRERNARTVKMLGCMCMTICRRLWRMKWAGSMEWPTGERGSMEYSLIILLLRTW